MPKNRSREPVTESVEAEAAGVFFAFPMGDESQDSRDRQAGRRLGLGVPYSIATRTLAALPV